MILEIALTKFLWLKNDAPPSGFKQVPAGGMCLSAFTFISKVDEPEKILLGKYRIVPEWERLTGLDSDRLRRHSTGLTVPASHLKFGEDPREAGRRIIKEIIEVPFGSYKISEPWVETERWDSTPNIDDDHWDVSFYFNVVLTKDAVVTKPEWYELLSFYDPLKTPSSDYARRHQDVVARWQTARSRIH